jgi:thiamine-phosphate pyrophosphorylase
MVWDTISNIPNNTISTSFHSWAEIVENKFHYKYAFISPVFDSISKVGYKTAIDLSAINEVRRTCIIQQTYCPAIIGLGGVGINELPLLKKTGFDGAAMLGSIWLAKDPVSELIKAQDIIKTL